MVPAVRREHLQGTVPQEVSPLVDLSYCVIWPLDTANECMHTYECVGRGGGGWETKCICICERAGQEGKLTRRCECSGCGLHSGCGLIHTQSILMCKLVVARAV